MFQDLLNFNLPTINLNYALQGYNSLPGQHTYPSIITSGGPVPSDGQPSGFLGEDLPPGYKDPFTPLEGDVATATIGILEAYLEDESVCVSYRILRNHHEELERFISEESGRTVILRVLFFVNDLPEYTTVAAGSRTTEFSPSFISPETTQLLHDKLGVSPLYLSILRFGDSPGLTCHLTRKKAEDGYRNETPFKVLESIEGAYDFSDGTQCQNSHWVWFSYSKERPTNYIIKVQGGHALVAEIVAYAQNPSTTRPFLRPMAIDALVATHGLSNIMKKMAKPTTPLAEYERNTVYGKLTMKGLANGDQSSNPEVDYAPSILHLQALANQWADCRLMLATSTDRLTFLARISVLFRQNPHFIPQRSPRKPEPEFKADQINIQNVQIFQQDRRSSEEDEELVSNSFSQLLSAYQTQLLWVERYASRTQAQISLHCTLAAQRDSQTNLRIAELTSRIATKTREDSASMITIAMLTMFFLPATFVATVLSMPFFEATSTRPDPQSNPAAASPIHDFTVSPKIWIFPAVSVPLTIIVFGIWKVWRIYRARKAQRVQEGVKQD